MAAALTSIEGTGTEEDRARRLLEEMRARLMPVAEVMQEARAQGFDIQFNLSLDQFGRYRPSATIVKPLGTL